MYNVQIRHEAAVINFKMITDSKLQMDIDIPIDELKRFLDNFSFVNLEPVKIIYDEETENDCMDEAAIVRNEEKLLNYIENELTSVELISYLKEVIRCL